jgi:hypothetical protein
LTFSGFFGADTIHFLFSLADGIKLKVRAKAVRNSLKSTVLTGDPVAAIRIQIGGGNVYVPPLGKGSTSGGGYGEGNAYEAPGMSSISQ